MSNKYVPTAPKKTPTQLKKELEALQEKYTKLAESKYCYMCDTHKSKDNFYISTDPRIKSGIAPICSECARKLALRVDKNGEEHTPTKESVQLALYYLNKPFIESVWNASIQESEDLAAGRVKANVWSAYPKNIAMKQWVGLTYKDSDMFREKIIYEDEKTAEDVMRSHEGQDTYDSFLKNKADVVRLLDYDPFEKEAISDQPFLYSQLLGLLDSSEEANEDMMRVSSAISIVRNFLQQQKIDDTIAKLMSDISQLEKNSATIKSLQESKSKITGVIKDLAAESCLSLKNSKTATKGENTWTGKIRKLKELGLRDAEVNGFDMDTCRGMSQVMDLSNRSIIRNLKLDESEWSDMVATQRQTIVDLQSELDRYQETARILLRENIDLKDYISDNSMDLSEDLVDLDNLFSVFSEEQKEESDGETSY